MSPAHTPSWSGRCGCPGGRSNSLAHFVLGEIARSEGRPDEALARYTRAVELGPQLAEAHYQYALALSGTGRLGEADFHFGRAAGLRGDYIGALASFRRARETLGTDPAWSARLDAGAGAHGVSGLRRVPTRRQGGIEREIESRGGWHPWPQGETTGVLREARAAVRGAAQRRGAQRAGRSQLAAGLLDGALEAFVKAGDTAGLAQLAEAARAAGDTFSFEAALRAQGKAPTPGEWVALGETALHAGPAMFAYRSFEKADHQEGLERTRREMFTAGIAAPAGRRPAARLARLLRVHQYLSASAGGPAPGPMVPLRRSRPTRRAYHRRMIESTPS